MIELENRRDRLFRNLKSQSVMILFSGVPKTGTEDGLLPFRVNRNFYYFTNIEQEESILVFVKSITEVKTYLFVSDYNELKEKWTGRKLTNDEAREISTIQNVYSLNTFETTMENIFRKEDPQYGIIENLYLDLTPEIKIGPEQSTKTFADKMKEKYAPLEIVDAYPIVRDLRMIKSPEEVENIIKAIELTNNGLMMLMKNLKPGFYEYDLADMFEFYGRRNGKHSLAFDSIVAAGKNATCLHYPSQNDIVKDGDLVQFDLGFTNNLYCSDISRAYPVNGVYNTLQKQVYNAVLNCNKAVINYIKAGMTIKEVNDYAIEYLKNECIRLKLMDPNDDIKKYYFHNISHHLGLDTHDASLREKPLENGNVITVEPGLYFDKFGIGIRIEDDVLIKEGRAINLSSSIKKEPEEIEKLMKTRGF